MLNLFKAAPVVDETSSQWLFDTFQWALTHFDGDFFVDNSRLILPTNEFFPAREQSVEALAASVFNKVTEYCGLQHWPLQLVDPQYYVPQNYQVQQPVEVARGSDSNLPAIHNALSGSADKLVVSYDPVQLNQPQVMVSNYAAMLASYIMGLSGQIPPGGPDYRAPAIEVLAIFMGYGVMFSNTAYAFRGSCGSCHNHAANRTAVLSENEAIYATALFAVLKGIDSKTVTPHLKKHLRGLYKQAEKQIKARPDDLAPLQILNRKAELSAG